MTGSVLSLQGPAPGFSLTSRGELDCPQYLRNRGVNRDLKTGAASQEKILKRKPLLQKAKEILCNALYNKPVKVKTIAWAGRYKKIEQQKKPVNVKTKQKGKESGQIHLNTYMKWTHY